MVKRIATSLVAVAMGATALATAPAYADPVAPSPSPTPTSSAGENTKHDEYKPDPRILFVDVDPDTVVVGRRDSVTVTATVRTKDIKSVSIEVWEPSGHREHGGGDRSLSAQDKGGQADGPTYDRAQESWTFDWSHKTGFWKVHVEAVGVNGETVTAERGFVVKHKERPRVPRPSGPKATRIVDFDATPEPVRKGRKLTLEGSLQVAQCYGDWYYKVDGFVSIHDRGDRCYDSRDYWHSWHWLGSQDIDVYFQPAGSHRWRYVDTIETDDDGDFSTRVRAWQSGTWAVKFDGARGLEGSEASDFVKVWRH